MEDGFERLYLKYREWLQHDKRNEQYWFFESKDLRVREEEIHLNDIQRKLIPGKITNFSKGDSR